MYTYIYIYIYIYIYMHIYGRRKLFSIECYTRRYVRIRRSCQVQPLQQRDAHKILNVGGKYSV